LTHILLVKEYLRVKRYNENHALKQQQKSTLSLLKQRPPTYPFAMQSDAQFGLQSSKQQDCGGPGLPIKQLGFLVGSIVWPSKSKLVSNPKTNSNQNYELCNNILFIENETQKIKTKNSSYLKPRPKKCIRLPIEKIGHSKSFWRISPYNFSFLW
jgi:hypothetical protein